jgi:hypothetical protein
LSRHAVSFVASAAAAVCCWLAALIMPGLPVRVAPEVTVLVDRSPSTRGAIYHDPQKLDETLDRMLPGVAFRVFGFADARLVAVSTPVDPSVGRTTPPALSDGVVLLFSDGQFDSSPLNAPTFCVVDPSFDSVDDASIESARRGAGGVAVVHVAATSSTTVTSGGVAVPVGVGRQVVRIEDPGATVDIESDDRWPENDTFRLAPTVRREGSRLWLGDDRVEGFETWSPRGDAAIVVANNADRIQIESAGPDIVRQVRDGGAGLLLVGGDRAFSAGGWGGSLIDTLSPLASLPPASRQRRMVLLDTSGSMAGDRLAAGLGAAQRVVDAVPASDEILLCGFARDLSWWSLDDRRRVVVPAGLRATGPTNLQAAIRAVTSKVESTELPTKVLVISDGRAELGEPVALARELKAKRVEVSWLAIDGGGSPLSDLVAATGGRRIEPTNVGAWSDAAVGWVGSTASVPLRSGETDVNLFDLAPVRIMRWAQTWPRAGVDVLATEPNVAIWQVGRGRVLAVAFAVPSHWVDTLVRRVEQPARESTWHVDVSMSSARAVLRVEHPTETRVEVFPTYEIDAGKATEMKSTAPGRFEAAFDLPAAGGVATVRVGDRLIDRIGLHGARPVEFQHIGNDRRSLQALAKRTGGAVLDFASAGPITLPTAWRTFSLAPWLTLAGLLLLGCAVVSGRRAGVL